MGGRYVKIRIISGHRSRLQTNLMTLVPYELEPCSQEVERQLWTPEDMERDQIEDLEQEIIGQDPPIPRAPQIGQGSRRRRSRRGGGGVQLGGGGRRGAPGAFQITRSGRPVRLPSYLQDYLVDEIEK